MICNGVGLLFVVLWMCVVFVVRSVHRTGERERGERGEGEERLFFYPFTAIINAIIEFETGTSSS